MTRKSNDGSGTEKAADGGGFFSFLRDPQYSHPLLRVLVLDIYSVLMVAAGYWEMPAVTWFIWLDWAVLCAFGLLKLLFLLAVKLRTDMDEAMPEYLTVDRPPGWQFAVNKNLFKCALANIAMIFAYLGGVYVWLSSAGYVWLYNFAGSRPPLGSILAPLVYLLLYRAYFFYAHFIRQDADKLAPGDIIAETMVRFCSVLMGALLVILAYFMAGQFIIAMLAKVLPMQAIFYMKVLVCLLAWSACDTVIVVWGKIRD